MGTKIPSTLASANQHADGLITQALLQEKHAWQQDRGLQGNKTATILRYTESGGAYYAEVEPDYAQVEGLANLQVWVDDYTKSYVDRHGAQTSKSDKMFVLYDVLGNVEHEDVIVFDGDEYKIASVWRQAESGRVEIRGTMIEDDSGL